jgi:hypothetical protein
MVINDLFIRIRSYGKQQTALAERLNELKWMDDADPKISLDIVNIQSQLEDIERQIEPLVREWMNRSGMAMQTIEHLDDYKKFIEQQGSGGASMVVISPSRAEVIAPEITRRLEQTGEFELARQSLLAAHIHGGIEQCSELTRLQVREFMDRIMVHEDPQHLLLHISDEKTRDNVAFLMAEAMASFAGSQAVQKAIDEGTGLTLAEEQTQNLRAWMKRLFNNAKQQGRKATITSLLPKNISTP